MTRRATASSSSRRWWSPMAKRRWRIASTSRSTSRENRRRRNHADHRRLLHDPQLALDLSRQRVVCRYREAQRRDRQRQARQVRADLREDRRVAFAETFAAAARLPDDGIEALARGSGHPAGAAAKTLSQ